MLVVLNYLFDIIIFSFLIYSIHLNYFYKKETEQIKQNLTNLQILMDLSQEGWIISKRCEDSWIIEQASSQFCDILGYGWISEIENEVIGMCKDDLVNVYPTNTTYNKDKVVSVYLNQLRKKDGKQIWVETSGKTISIESDHKRISLVKNVEHIIARFKDEK